MNKWRFESREFKNKGIDWDSCNVTWFIKDVCEKKATFGRNTLTYVVAFGNFYVVERKTIYHEYLIFHILSIQFIFQCVEIISESMLADGKMNQIAINWIFKIHLEVLGL